MIKRLKQAAIRISGLLLFLAGVFGLSVANWVQDAISHCDSVVFGCVCLVAIYAIFTYIENKLKS